MARWPLVSLHDTQVECARAFNGGNSECSWPGHAPIWFHPLLKRVLLTWHCASRGPIGELPNDQKMTRSLSRTLHGRAALDAFTAYLALKVPDQRPPDELRGQDRSDYANYQAVLTFVAELASMGARHVYLESGERVPLGQARFRPYQGDPDIDGDEGTVGFHPWTVSLDGIRVRMSAPGVLEMADRWGDSAKFGTSKQAPFGAAHWETDVWDLPAPVAPLFIGELREPTLTKYASTMAQKLFETAPTDRQRAELTIASYYQTVWCSSEAPKVYWFSGPSAAIQAMGPYNSGGGSYSKTMRERALMSFDMEITARLQGKRDYLKSEIYKAISGAVKYDVWETILDLVVTSKVQGAFNRMGLIVDYDLVGWYEMLQYEGAKLPEVVISFIEMTREAWLMFPARDAVYAVERPVSREETGRGTQRLRFSNGEVLEMKLLSDLL